MKRGRPKGRSRDNRSFGPLGDLIRTARLSKGLGLADVAKACACSVQFISNIEHGRAPLPWDKVAQMASFLKISVDELQAANLAIRSDFKSFVSISKITVETTAKKSTRNPAAHVLSGAFTVAARDSQIREVIERYQAATLAEKKKFYKAALKMLA